MENETVAAEWGFTAEEIASQYPKIRSAFALTGLLIAFASAVRLDPSIGNLDMANNIKNTVAKFSVGIQTSEASAICLQGAFAYSAIIKGHQDFITPESFKETKAMFSQNMQSWNAEALAMIHYHMCEGRPDLMTRDDFILFRRVAENKDYPPNARTSVMEALTVMANDRPDLVTMDDYNAIEKIGILENNPLNNPLVIAQAQVLAAELYDILQHPNEPLRQINSRLGKGLSNFTVDEISAALDGTVSSRVYTDFLIIYSPSVEEGESIADERIVDSLRRQFMTEANEHRSSQEVLYLNNWTCATLANISEKQPELVTWQLYDEVYNGYMIAHKGDIRENFLRLLSSLSHNRPDMVTTEAMKVFNESLNNEKIDIETRKEILVTVSKVSIFNIARISDDVFATVERLSLLKPATPAGKPRMLYDPATGDNIQMVMETDLVEDPNLALASMAIGIHALMLDARKFPDEPIRKITLAIMAHLPDEEIAQFG